MILLEKSRLHGRLLGVESLFGTFAGSWADRRYFLAQFCHSYISYLKTLILCDGTFNAYTLGFKFISIHSRS